MTLSSLLASARVIASDPHVHTFVAQFAQAVVGLLADDGTDCGMPMPRLTRMACKGASEAKPRVVIDDDCCGPWGPADARSFARALLAAADEAEGKGEG